MTPVHPDQFMETPSSSRRQPSSAAAGRPLGERVLQQMALGLRDDQTDIDIRDESRKNASVHNREHYQPRANGQVVDKKTGRPVPQAYQFDETFMDTEIGYDRALEETSDYKLAQETAGYVNISIEEFVKIDNTVINNTLRSRQEKLLIKERKKKFISFAERNDELIDMRKTREEIENVLARLNLINQSAALTVARWYWLMNINGCMPRSSVVEDQRILDKMDSPPVPYWLMTHYLHAQYASRATASPKFKMDATYWRPFNDASAWGLKFLESFSVILDLLSLTEAQRNVASGIYLCLRDGVLMSTLRLASPTGVAVPVHPSANAPTLLVQPDPVENIVSVYQGLLLSSERLRRIVYVNLKVDTIKTTSITWNEVSVPPNEDNVRIRAKADANDALVETALPNSDLLIDTFSVQLIAFLTAESDIDLPGQFALDPQLQSSFYDEGVLGTLLELSEQFKGGIDLTGFGNWISLLQTTLLSASLIAEDATLVTALVNGNKFAFGELLFDIDDNPGDFEEERGLLAYAVAWAADTEFEYQAELNIDNDKNLDFTITKTESGATLNIHLEAFSTEIHAAVDEFLEGVNLFLERLGLGIDVLDDDDDDDSQRQRLRFLSTATRLLLSFLFWSKGLQNASMVEILMDAFEHAVRNGTEDFETMRDAFDDATPFLRVADQLVVPLLNILQRETNIAAHFYRELIRTTFVGAYDRSNIDPALLNDADGLPNSGIYKDDVKVEKDVIKVELRPLPPPVPPAGQLLPAAAAVPPVAPPPAPPLRLNDSVFFETWEKMYANLFLPNSHEYVAAALPNLNPTVPYWRDHFRRLVNAQQTRISAEPLGQFARRSALSTIWSAVDRDALYLTSSQVHQKGVPNIDELSLKLVTGSDPESNVAIEQRIAYRKMVNLVLAKWNRSVVPTPATFPMPDGRMADSIPPMAILQALVIYVLYYYPIASENLHKQLDQLNATQTKMIELIQASLTNDPSLALDELKLLAHETYLPDARYHMQSKYTGRLVFKALFITALHAAYANLQHLAHLPPPPEFNMYGKRSRAIPIDYSHLGDVPLDVLSANTDPATDASSGAPTRDYVDMDTTSTSTLMMLRSGMSAMIAQFIFGIRLDAPDEYKSVIQHKRAPLQLAAAQKAMAKFRFSKSGKPRGWTVTIQY